MKLADNPNKLIILIALLMCIGTPFYGTEKDQDMETLWEVELSKKFKKSIEISLGEELRTRDFVNEINRLSTTVGIVYNHPQFKQLKVGGEYNFLNYFEYNKFEENRHRIALHIQYKYSYAGFDFSFRSRFQSTFRDETRGDYKVNPKYIWRNRIGIAYNIYGTPYEPYFNFEISNPVRNTTGNQINRLRYRVGCEYRFNKKQAFDLFFRCTQEINEKNAMNTYSIGLGYKFKL